MGLFQEYVADHQPTLVVGQERHVLVLISFSESQLGIKSFLELDTGLGLRVLGSVCLAIQQVTK